MTTSAADTARPRQLSCHNCHLRFFANSEMGPLKSFHKFFEGFVCRPSRNPIRNQQSPLPPAAAAQCTFSKSSVRPTKVSYSNHARRLKAPDGSARTHASMAAGSMAS